MTEDKMSTRTATTTASLDISISQPSAQSADFPAGPSSEYAILNRLLGMARAYRDEGSVNNAMDIFWQLVDEYPDTPQAEHSKNALLEIAVQYEKDDLRHPAYAIYERLL
jgi:outer membrane protein assembly factor BamD (BamD/ComL family)